MTREVALTEFFSETFANPPSQDLRPLSFYIAREFANHPSSEPAEFSDEIDALCERLSLDPDEMLTLIAGAIESVKYPRGVAYENVVEKAKKEPKRFRVVFKGKRFTLINIIYQLSCIRCDRLFNIPAEMVAASAHTTVPVVYAFITELKKRGFIAEVESYIPNVKGRLFRWLEEPVN